MPSRPARFTGACRGCGVRRLINADGNVIRLHNITAGAELVECAGSLRPAAAGTTRRRSAAPPARPRDRLTLVEQRCREFRCIYCRAAPGEACVTLVKRTPTTAHGNRFTQATAAGRLPLTDAEHAADREARS